jgi:hypothetical protein
VGCQTTKKKDERERRFYYTSLFLFLSLKKALLLSRMSLHSVFSSLSLSLSLTFSLPQEGIKESYDYSSKTE